MKDFECSKEWLIENFGSVDILDKPFFDKVILKPVEWWEWDSTKTPQA